MDGRVVGTNVAGVEPIGSWLQPPPDGARDLAVASAYWDRTTCTRAIAQAESLGGRAQVLLWTAGASRPAWIAARDAHVHPALDLRFIDSPHGGGIFHVKLYALADGAGAWLRAMVGSANMTAAGHARNIELGVVVERFEQLAPLHAWFVDMFELARPASTIDWDAALAIAPETSEANARKLAFAAAALAPPAKLPTA